VAPALPLPKFLISILKTDLLTQMEVGMAPIKYANMINPISVINYLSYLPIVILTKFSRQIYEQKV
jgi:hypothetical protein